MGPLCPGSIISPLWVPMGHRGGQIEGQYQSLGGHIKGSIEGRIGGPYPPITWPRREKKKTANLTCMLYVAPPSKPIRVIRVIRVIMVN